MHESELYEENCFLTLTYEEVPEDASVSVRELQLFFKRLRKKYAPRSIRYFACGEYGEDLARPHYHALLFGFDFPDKVFAKMSGDHRIYESETLSQLWGHGLAWIGAVSFESAAYVARYVLKKRTGKAGVQHYRSLDMGSGELRGLTPEFVVMSRRPGIGSQWFSRFGSDVYGRDQDFVVVRGMKMRPPKFYDGKLEAVDPGLFHDIKVQRLRAADHPSVKANNTDDRLTVRETVQQAKQSLTSRRFEDDR